MIRRVLVAITGLILCIFGVLPAASAASIAAPAPSVSYTYDAPHLWTEYNNAVSERGPPGTPRRAISCCAVGRLPHGASVRPSAPTVGPIYDFDDNAQFVHVGSATGPATKPAESTNGGLRAFPPSEVAAKAGPSAYGVAMSGGKHAGFLTNYLGRSTPEIKRGITSIERQIAEHQAKIRDPDAYIDDWASLDPRQQQALLTSKWPSDIARQQEQLEILRGILGSR